MTKDEEQIIIQKVISGDKEAFEALVLANQSRVYNLALKMTHSREDAFDIAQEAFLKAYNQLAGFRGGSLFSVWLYKITYNLCIDHLRKSVRESALPIDAEDEFGEEFTFEIPDLSNLPEDSVMRGETRRAVADGINLLPFHHREVLVMHIITGMSYEDIAATLGVSIGTVKSRLSRARLKLLTFLCEKGTFPDGFRQKTGDDFNKGVE